MTGAGTMTRAGAVAEDPLVSLMRCLQAQRGLLRPSDLGAFDEAWGLGEQGEFQSY